MTGQRKTPDYKKVYQQRKERLAKRGLTPYQAEKLRKERGSIVYGPVDEKRATLAKFGVSERQFEGMRIANLEHAPFEFEKFKPKSKKAKRALSQAAMLNYYDDKRDIPNDWSEDRVGYVVSFFRAIVDPRTNYDSLLDKDGNRIILKNGKRKSNKWQKLYLTQYAEGVRRRNDEYVYYGNFLDPDEYDERYGEN